MELSKIASFLVVTIVMLQGAYAHDKQDPVLTTDALKAYVACFNADDEELYANIPNKDAFAFLEENIPLFECPDKDFERTYYFRWWTYRKHLKNTEDGYVITEFLPEVPWSGKHNTISCPAAHHYYEGRWLHNPVFLDDYSVFWLRRGGQPRLYSFWIADAFYARELVTPNEALLINLLPDLVKNYEAWEKGWEWGKYQIGQHENGLFYTIDDRDGGEVSIGGHGYRPTLNSFMYGDARAIATISHMAGKADQAMLYEGKAERIKQLIQEKLWDKEAQFFKILPEKGEPLVDVREIYGYTPWYFNLPDPGYEAGWKELMDPGGFHAPYGPTFAEQRHPGFIISYEGHECQWNGPSWPLATCSVLTALANLLNNYEQEVIGREDYFETLSIYTKSHQLRREDRKVVPWIDENLNPYTGDWIARTRLKTWENGTWSDKKGGYERGKDYNHSSYNDLIITGLVGLRPRADNIVEVNPLLPDDTWDYFCLDNVLYHGRILTIIWDKTGHKYGRGQGLTVYADGIKIAHSKELSSISGSLPFSPSAAVTHDEDLKIWYDRPARVIKSEQQVGKRGGVNVPDRGWLKALPLANGSLGLMVFGDVNLERIQLNEESMWSGSPGDSDNPDAYKELDKIRNLLFEGKYREATELTNKTQICKGAGSRPFGPFGSFQTLGDLWIDNGSNSGYQNYHRELDLRDAVVRISYIQDEVHYSREIFASNPDQLMVARFTADQPGKISFTCGMDRPERFNTHTENHQLVMRGSLPDGKGGDGLRYMARLKAVNKSGSLSYTDSTLNVENADEVILLLSASTDYVWEYPVYKGRDYEKITVANIEAAEQQTYNDLLKRHLDEYHSYFSRLSFDITEEPPVKLPIDQRIEKFKQTQSDPRLVELFFQYGRYLLISSSRPGTMPANLQGIWADGIRCPWNGDYHTDVNVQMNYWPANVTNLSEIQLPLFDLIESLVEPGKKTASAQYNMKGWVVHPITNVWGFTSPGEKASWGMHLGAGAWLCSHIWDHYAFTDDREFLQRMYPVMKGSVEFYLDWLVENPHNGKLVSGPAVSPENTFIAPDGSRSQICMGPAHDQQVIWQLFTDFIAASQELNVSDPIVKHAVGAKLRLAGMEIASDGRLMEWPEEFPEVEPGHRHISHLFALHPGSQINMEETPELASAAKKSLDYRIENGGGHTGWSAAWLISQYARLYEGEKAKENLNTVLSRSIAPNLFGLHPPFQIDANFGTTAGIAEMLIQSHTGRICLLPALPESWPYGKVNGLKARGGYELDIEWKNKELVRAEIYSESGKPCRIVYKGRETVFEPGKGERLTIRRSDF